MTDGHAPMTADDLAAELYRRQGYLVISAIFPADVGDLNRSFNLATNEHCGTVMRVVCGSSRAELIAQRALAEQITGEPIDIPIVGEFFYRVEAAD